MLVYGLDNETFDSFYFFKNLEIKREINKLDISCFEIPKDYRNIFETECKVIENKQSYTIKNIEPFYDGYKIECKQNIDEWLSFFHKSVNFPYKDIETMIKGIIPDGWSYLFNGEIKKYRTITADHKSSWEVLEEIVKKFDVEFRIDNNEKILFISEEIGEDKGVFFSDNFNVVDKDISVESFEFATRIIPEGMNGLKINQINDGKDYLENKSYSGKTINYYWKDERYTNIQNLKDEAARKLEVLSRPRVSIKLKVKDLSKAIGVYEQEYNVGDYVYLIDKDRKTKEKFRILEGTFYPNRPFNNEITLANKPLDLVSDVDENIELTKEMWEETRVRFETTEDAIKSSVATAKRYSDDSFKTYKTEREQTDSRIYESITESTTYVDPKTGQTKPIIDKQLEIDKTIDGINISLRDQLTADKDFNLRLDNLKTNISENTLSLNSKIDKDLAKAKKELGDSIDYTKIDFKKRHDLLALELENANNDINKAKEKISGLSNNFDDFNTRANNKYEVIDREILGIKSNFKIARDEISAEIVSASKTQEKAIKEMGDDTESKIKTFLNLNYSTKTQTDQKISQEVGSLKTLVNSDINNLEKEIIETKSKIEQTDAKISSQITLYEVNEIVDSKTSDFNRRISEAESKIEQTSDKIESTVSGINYEIYKQVKDETSGIEGDITKLKSRVTSAETSIRQTQNTIDFKVKEVKTSFDDSLSKMEQENSARDNVVQNLQADLSIQADKIESKVSKYDFGTRIRQSATDIKFAWNNYSNYIQFEYGSIGIYDGSLSENKKRSMFDERGIHFYRDGYYVGKIGTNKMADDEKIKGLVFDLEYEAYFMSWSVKRKKSDNYYTRIWTYSNGGSGNYSYDTLNAGCDIDMNGNTLKNVNFEGGGINGTLNFQQIHSVASDGTANSWTSCSLEFKNGILVGGSWGR